MDGLAFDDAEPDIAMRGAPRLPDGFDPRRVLLAERVGVSRPTVNLWRARYGEAGLAGLADLDRPGRPKTVDQRLIIAETPLRTPNALVSLAANSLTSRITQRRRGAPPPRSLHCRIDRQGHPHS